MFVQAFHGRTIIISVWTNLVFFVLKAKKKIRKVEWRADPVNFVEPALANTAVASLRTNRSFVILLLFREGARRGAPQQNEWDRVFTA